MNSEDFSASGSFASVPVEAKPGDPVVIIVTKKLCWVNGSQDVFETVKTHELGRLGGKALPLGHLLSHEQNNLSIVFVRFPQGLS